MTRYDRDEALAIVVSETLKELNELKETNETCCSSSKISATNGRDQNVPGL